MFNADLQTLAKLAPNIERVLVVEPFANSAELLISLLRTMGSRKVEVFERSAAGLKNAASFHPQLLLTELHGPKVDGVEFTRAVRRSDLVCRKAPIIVMNTEPTAQTIKAARDAGAHEFLRKPFTAGDLFKRVENVALRPRSWVEAVMYVGPDRRRFNSGEYDGPLKRRSDAGAVVQRTSAGEFDQALKIVKAALKHFQSDPQQAVRAIRTQLETLTTIALASRDPRLIQAVGVLGGRMSGIDTAGPPKDSLASSTAMLKQIAEAGLVLEAAPGKGAKA